MSFNGESINSGSINGSGISQQEAYELWLLDENAEVVHLVEIDYNGTSAVYPNWVVYTLKLSDIPFPGYLDRVKSIGGFVRQIGEKFTGTVSGSYGEITLSNEDGALDLWNNLSIDGQRVRVLHGHPSWDVSMFRVVYEAIAEMAPLLTWDSLTVRLRGIDYKANLPIQTNLITNNTTTNSSSNLPIPKAFGQVFNVTPAVVDSTNEVYQWNDGAVVSVTDVRDGGIRFQTPQIALSGISGNLINTATSHGFVANTRVRSDIGSLNAFATWGKVVWNGEFFLSISYDTLSKSYDGIYWQTLPYNLSTLTGWLDVAWNGSVFCMVGANASGTYFAAVSSDGITWTTSSLPITNASMIAWNGSVFCTCSFNGTTAATSPDGITWTARTLPAAAQVITFGGGKFCVLGTVTASTSTDGITWANNPIPSTYSGGAITYGGNQFCAVLNSTNTAITSPDGNTWTARTMSASSSWSALAWNGSVFCAASQSSIVAATSPDGITWTARTLPSFPAWVSMAWNGSVFCLIPSLSNNVTTSPDGANWSATSGLLPSPLSKSTDYWVISDGLTTTAFKVSATMGGSAITLSAVAGDIAPLIGYHWTADNTTGKILLDQRPAGVITLDGVAGTTDASSIIISALSATNIDPSSQAAFQIKCNQPVGVYIKERENKLDVAEKIISGLNAWYGYSREGMLRFGRVEAYPTVPDFYLTEDDMVQQSLQVTEILAPEKQHRLSYKYNWTTQEDALFAGVSADNRALYSNEYSSSAPISSTDVGANGSFHALNIIPDVQTSMMARGADARTEAARLDAMYFGWGALYVVDVGRIGTLIDIGNIVNVTHARFGLESGVNMTVVAITDTPTDGLVNLTMFRALPTYTPGQL